MPENVFAGSPFLRQCAEVDRRTGGPRATLRMRHDRVAGAVRRGDDPTLLDAARQLEQILAIARRDLGERDPDTLVVEGTLASAYLLGDDETRGLHLARRTLTARQQVFGADHPSTLAAADAVAAALRITGRPDEAVRRYEDVLTRRRRVLGEAHADTLATRAALALAHADAGELRGAAELLAATLRTAERFLGPGHPVANQVRELLDECRAVLAAPVPVATGEPRPVPGRPGPAGTTPHRPAGPVPAAG